MTSAGFTVQAKNTLSSFFASSLFYSGNPRIPHTTCVILLFYASESELIAQ